MTIRRLFGRIRLELIQWSFRRAIEAVHATAPLLPGKSPFIALSMVQHKDLASYLVAIKSFAHFLQPRKIVIICDPSITAQDEAQ